MRGGRNTAVTFLPYSAISQQDISEFETAVELTGYINHYRYSHYQRRCTDSTKHASNRGDSPWYSNHHKEFPMNRILRSFVVQWSHWCVVKTWLARWENLQCAKLVKIFPFVLAGLLCVVPRSEANLITTAVGLGLEFVNAGFKSPTIVMNETEKTFDLSIQGSIVDHSLGDDTGSFSSEPFQLDFWRGTFTFSQVDGQINPDSVTAGMSIFHQAGINRPHPGDALKGSIFTVPAAVRVNGNPALSFGGTVTHPSNDFDEYSGGFSVTGTGTEITGWSFRLIGKHVVPLPAAVWLFGSGLLGLLGMSCRKAGI